MIAGAIVDVLGFRRPFFTIITPHALLGVTGFCVVGYVGGRAIAWQQRVARLSPIERAHRVFGLLSALLPRRIADEELGDALEEIAALISARRPRLEIRLKVWSTVFWVSIHTAGYLANEIGKAIGILAVLKAICAMFTKQ